MSIRKFFCRLLLCFPVLFALQSCQSGQDVLTTDIELSEAESNALELKQDSLYGEMQSKSAIPIEIVLKLDTIESMLSRSLPKISAASYKYNLNLTLTREASGIRFIWSPISDWRFRYFQILKLVDGQWVSIYLNQASHSVTSFLLTPDQMSLNTSMQFVMGWQSGGFWGGMEKHWTRKTIPVKALSDINLENAVNTQFGRSSDQITMREIRSLTAMNRSVYNLEGIRYAVNLKDLNISSNSIQSLEDLRYCTGLNVLNLNNNMIQSLEPLVGLPLTDLSCNTNSFSGYWSIYQNRIYLRRMRDAGTNIVTDINF